MKTYSVEYSGKIYNHIQAKDQEMAEYQAKQIIRADQPHLKYINAGFLFVEEI